MIPNNLLNQLNSLKANPMQYLMQSKFNIPSNLSNPNDIIQHLLNTGQISQNQLNAINQQVRNMQYKG